MSGVVLNLIISLDTFQKKDIDIFQLYTSLTEKMDFRYAYYVRLSQLSCGKLRLTTEAMGIWRFAGAFAVVERQSECGSKDR